MSKHSLFARVSKVGFVMIGLALAAPAADAAAQDKVYTAAEVTTPPAVKSTSAAANAIQRTTPPALATMAGRVQLRFVVEPTGKVDPSSIEIVAASASALGEAAKKAIERIEFTPGMVNGQAVRSVVMFPVTYSGR